MCLPDPKSAKLLASRSPNLDLENGLITVCGYAFVSVFARDLSSCLQVLLLDRWRWLDYGFYKTVAH